MSIIALSDRKAASYSQSITVCSSPSEAFTAVSDGIRYWWSDVVAGGCAKDQTVAVVFGTTAKLLKTVERTEGKRLVWMCEAVLMADATSDYPKEWVGTTMAWDFAPSDDGCVITLTHQGLTPELECYDTCSKAWSFFVMDSLKAYLETGKGDPHINGA